MLRTALITILFLIPYFLLANGNNGPKGSVQFTENKGQWETNVLFKADFAGGVIYLEKNCITFDLFNAGDMEKISPHGHAHDGQSDTAHSILRKHCYKLWFDDANTKIVFQKNDPSSDYKNYFIGNDKNKWANKVYSYGEVVYQNIYPGIDLKIYSRGGNLKYDFIIHPGGDPKNIRLRYEGLDQVSLYNNTLQLTASFAQLTESAPLAYIQTDNYKLPVQCKYILNDKSVTFALPQLYDKNYPLIIDPELIFASYSGSSEDNWGSTATFDPDGNLYGGGIAFGSGYPTTIGAYQTSYEGGTGYFPFDVSISKFNDIGTDLIWSTYLGGSGNEFPHSLIVNNAGELLIYGTTGSDDFPMTADAYDDSFNGGPFEYVDDVLEYTYGIDIIVAKLSADGTALNGATYIGGTETDGANLANATLFNYGDNARGEVVVDESDNVYIASCTYSDDFPVTVSAFQNSIAGNQDGCVFKLNADLSELIWSSYIGGASADGAYSLKLNSAGEILTCGGTASTGFPATDDVWHDTYQGGTADGWVAKINSAGSEIIACSFIGTSSYDQTYFVETDDNDFVYITGQSKGVYPVIDADYSETGGKQYITKLNTDLSDVIYSTIFGSGSAQIDISPSAFLVDDCENVYVSGWGGSVNFEGSTDGMTTTADAIDPTTDGSDFYFFVLAKNAIDILYGSYFGGVGVEEHVDGGTSRFDKSGTIYQAVCAGCGGSNAFPTTDDAWSEVNGSWNCNLGVGKIKLDLAGVYAISDAEPSLSGCIPFTVYFDNLSSDAEEYIWTFGDGSTPSSAFEPIYTYEEIGIYSVMLVVIDSNSCNIADTAYLTIEVSNGNIEAQIDSLLEQNCDELTLTIFDFSTIFPTTEYNWTFGDGTSSTLASPTHTYTEAGTYNVELILSDSTSCNKFDTIAFEVNYLFDFNTGYDVVTDGCLPVTAIFSADFDGADAYLWDFGDGGTATTQNATHDYTEPGTYTVTLSITFCDITDVYTETFTVFPLPVAGFNSEPSFGIANAATLFISECENAVSYLWEFSDGEFSTEENATHYFPGLGTFEVCLTATNAAGCTDTYCRGISIEDEGSADIPTGFSPNGDGANDVLFVKGFGFARMDLKIFNRWGELVFETTNQAIGWDGTLRGKPLDMDVFVFMLNVDFVDGNYFEKTGNVTLIR